MTCVGKEMTHVSTEIVRDPAAMTKNLTEMKSVRAEISRASAEIGFFGTNHKDAAHIEH